MLKKKKKKKKNLGKLVKLFNEIHY